jgi:AbiTii
VESRSEHILALAKELLDDIELSRLGAESLLLKASRLARWVGSDEVRHWLQLEMSGYYLDDPISLKYMGLTGRWIDTDKKQGYWGPLAQQEAAIVAEKAKLASMRTPDSSSEYAAVAIYNVTQAMTASANYISRLSAIKSRVLARIHTFVSEIYYEKQFDSLSESIFERYKRGVDSRIAETCGNVLEKIPSVMDRLSEGDAESINQALVTCRRIIEAFADSLFPLSDETIEIGGNTLKLDASKHQNRLNAYVHQRVQSQSRKQKIRQNLANLFDRVSTGVHKDVTAEEARSLFLNTYLFLGEILHLDEAVK